ncbi:hypothetical protein O3M35_007693 [Rhynocoris fuscipes]|uniref:Uncharacterized protein n=1 Tax=Rhynocoris fuscipes TaxID=488301 RepID=A0AAW1DA91_9HEMI
MDKYQQATSEALLLCVSVCYGHDFLGRHLFRIGVFPHPRCILCNGDEEMTGALRNLPHFRGCSS